MRNPFRRGRAARAVLFDGLSFWTAGPDGAPSPLSDADGGVWHVVAGPEVSHMEAVPAPDERVPPAGRAGAVLFSVRECPWERADGDAALFVPHPREGMVRAEVLKGGTASTALARARLSRATPARIETFASALFSRAGALLPKGPGCRACAFVGEEDTWIVGLEEAQPSCFHRLRLGSADLRAMDGRFSGALARVLDSLARRHARAGTIDGLCIVHDRRIGEAAKAALGSGDLSHIQWTDAAPAPGPGDAAVGAALLGAGSPGSLDFMRGRGSRRARWASEPYLAALAIALLAKAPDILASRQNEAAALLRSQAAVEVAAASTRTAAPRPAEPAPNIAPRSLDSREAAVARGREGLETARRLSAPLDPMAPARLLAAIDAIESGGALLSDLKAVWLPDGSGAMEATGVATTPGGASAALKGLSNAGLRSEIGSGGVYGASGTWVWQTRSPVAAPAEVAEARGAAPQPAEAAVFQVERVQGDKRGGK